MKAMEKDRNRRYESASAFAADVRRYLSDDAVEACPPSASYRLRKYVRRNRRILVPAGIVALALVTATAVSMWQAVRANDAQHQAETDRKQAEADRDRAAAAETQAKAAEKRAATDAAVARAVNEFLQVDLLGQAASARPADREIDGNPYLTVKEALDRAAAGIGQRFQDQPLVEAAIRTAIGTGYRSLYEHERAVFQLERALALRESHLGPDHPDTLGAMATLAEAYTWVGRFPDAIALRQYLLENRKAFLGPDHSETMGCVADLATAYQIAGQWDTSVRLWEHLLEQHRAILGPTHDSTIRVMHWLAMNYTNMDRFPDSIALHETVLKHRGSTTDPDIWTMMTCAIACQEYGKLERAESLLREAVTISRKQTNSFGQRMMTANACGWLARTLLLKKQYSAAEPFVREAIAIWEKEVPNNQRRFYWVSLLGAVRLGQQDYPEAERLLLQGYEGMKQREAILPANEKRRLGEVSERVVRFYEATNQPEKARAWREKVLKGKSENQSN